MIRRIKKDLTKNKEIKLHVGCGNVRIPGCINIDINPDSKADIIADVRSLPFPKNSVDLIASYHVIEHVHFLDALKMFRHWHAILKPNGWIVIECPDLVRIAKSFVREKIDNYSLYVNLYGEPWRLGQSHHYCWYPGQLEWALSGVGFYNFFHSRGKRYIENKWSLHLEAQKKP